MFTSEPAPSATPAPSRACHDCARTLGSEPATARFISEGGALRAVEICATCAGAPAGPRSESRAAVACTECGGPAPATSAAIASGSRISILCPRCSGEEEVPDSPAEAPRRWRRRAGPIGIGAVLGTLAAVGFTFAEEDSSAATATPSLLEPTWNAARLVGRSQGDTEVRVPPRERPQVHDLSYVMDGDEEVPLVWYHPLAGKRSLPDDVSRQFGAYRPGPRPGECGEGHCGVDLGNRRGRVVHAARPGLVDRIMQTSDRLGGKYVRLYHPEGFFTYYMHLDVIPPTLVPGVEVAAGEPLGLLGSTGITTSPPHLHFAVSRLLETGAQEYLDPEPMLRQAVVLEEPAPFPDSWKRPEPRIARASRPARPRQESGDSASEAPAGEVGAADAHDELEAAHDDAAEPEAGAPIAPDEEAEEGHLGIDLGAELDDAADLGAL